MLYVSLALFCIVALELFIRLRISGDALAIIARSQESMRVLRSADYSDDEKEALTRRGSLDIAKATLRFAFKFFLIALVLYLLYLSIVTLFPALKASLLHSLYSPVVIVALTIGTMGYAWLRKAALKRLSG